MRKWVPKRTSAPPGGKTGSDRATTSATSTLPSSKPSRSQGKSKYLKYTSFVRFPDELHLLERELVDAGCNAYRLFQYPRYTKIRSDIDLKNWIQSKPFEVSEKFFTGIIYTEHAAPAKDKLPYGIISAKKWGKSALALTFFSGFYLREALLNRIHLFGEFHQVFCVVGRKTSTKNFVKFHDLKKKKILEQFENSRSIIFKNRKVFSKSVRPLTYAQIVSSKSHSRLMSSDSDIHKNIRPTIEKKISNPDQIFLLSKENAGLRRKVNNLSISVKNLELKIDSLLASKTLNTSSIIIEEKVDSCIEAQVLHPSQSQQIQNSEPLKKNLRRSPRLNPPESETDAKHSTSLLNPQPSNDAQDGPLTLICCENFISKHQTSVYVPQTFELSQDGPSGEQVEEKEVEQKVQYHTCIIQSCPVSLASGWKHTRKLLSHYLDAHYNQMQTIDMSYWKELAAIGDKLTFCYKCKKLWSSKKKHCKDCSFPLCSFQPDQLSQSRENLNDDSDMSQDSSSQSIRQNVFQQSFSWLESLSFQDLLEKCNSSDLRTDLNEKLHVSLSKSLSLSLDFLLKCLRSNDISRLETAFKLFFIFPFCVLGKPRRSRNKKKNALNINKLTLSRLSRWINGDFHALFTEALDRNKRTFPSYNRPVNDHSNSKRAEFLVNLNRMSDAVKALSFRGFDSSEDCAEKLIGKHPTRTHFSVQELNNLVEHLPKDIFSGSIIITSDSVMRALQSFPKGTAVGFSGLSPLHLLRCCYTPRFPQIGDSCLQKLTDVLNFFIRGEIPPNAAQIFFGANLIAFNKKDGGIRPIAIGEILRRTLSKIVLEKIDFPFAPYQFGIKTKFGMETIAHSLRSIMKDSSVNPTIWKNQVVLKVDLANAFNSVSRDAFLHIIDHCLPDLSAFARLSYDHTPILKFGDHTIASSEGVQQGDPLGPIFFCFVLQSLILKIAHSHPSLRLNVWFMDDGVLIADHISLQKIIEVIQSFGFGLDLNLPKCEIFPLDKDVDLSIFPEEIERISGLSILGCPITHEKEFMSARIEKLKKSLSELEILDHTQSAFLLLKHCFGPLKLNHILRCCPSDIIQDEIKVVDDMQKQSLDKLLRSRISPSGLEQAFFHASKGGLGLKLASRVAPAGFIASSVATYESVKQLLPLSNGHEDSTLHAIEIFNGNLASSFCLENLVEIFKSEDSLQRFLRLFLEENDYKQFLDGLSSEDKDWLSNVSSDYKWFSNIPSKIHGTHMNNKDFITCILMRLRSMEFFDEAVCIMGKGLNQIVSSLDSRHCTGCPMGGGTIFRHDLVARIIFEEAESASLKPGLEIPNLIAENQTRPADVFIPNWHNGQAAALDVCIVAPARSTPNSPAKDFNAHIDDSYIAKLNSHENDCRSVGVLFFPIVFSTGGAIHPKSMPIIERIAELKAGRLGLSAKVEKKHILHRIGVGIQKGNAYCIHSHMASALHIAARRKNSSPAHLAPEAIIQDDAEESSLNE
jgi:hypothetical protein